MNSEALIRLFIFLGMVTAMAVWETKSPRRKQIIPRKKRWPANLGIVFLNTILGRILLPTTGIGLAALVQSNGWGLFSLWDAPLWVAVPLTILVMDFVIYLQHVLFHSVPLFWRFHRMHHTDPEFDFTTGNRFHPIEILISMGIKFSVIVALGAPPAGVLIFEVLLNATATFNHANAFLPLHIDRVLRWLLVTPDMHRVHHSIEKNETNSNYGFNLPWWDRLFGTYRAQPRKGHLDMTIGLQTGHDPAQDISLSRMLLFPFNKG